MTRWQAEGDGWQEAVIQEDQRLATTIQQISTTLQAFENQNRIKEAVPIQDYIDPASEKMEDCLNEEDLFEEIAACYSLTQEEIPDDDLDPVVPIRPAEALAAIQTLKDWEEQQDDSSHKVVRQLKDIEKRVKALQISHLQQRTLDSYFT